jgi:hypothetical protein
MIMQLKIPREKWAHGGNSGKGKIYLYHSRNRTSDLLGLYLRELGVPVKMLMSLTCVDAYLANTLYKHYPMALWMLAPKEEQTDGSQLSEWAQAIKCLNNSPNLSTQSREEALKALMKCGGIELVFTGDGSSV